jgi:hypothetical protein
VTHTQENIEFQTGNDFLGLEPAGCEYQKLFTASISEVEKNSNFGAASRATGTESSLLFIQSDFSVNIPGRAITH